MTTAYSYVRFSSAIQEQGDSIRRQTQSAKEACQKYGWTLDDTLKPDKGISAWKGKNRAEGSLADFYRMIGEGRIQSGSVLIVENLDRLSRQKPTVALSGLLQIINAGVRVHTTQDGMTYDTQSANANSGMALMASIIQIGLANQESEKKSERVSKAWRQKRLNAIKGSIITRKIPTWIHIIDGKMILIPERMAIIKTICDMIHAGQGYLAIARKLNADKIAKFGPGSHWTPSDIHYLFDHRKLIGDYRTTIDGKEKIITGYYPAVISEQEFNTIQAILLTRKNNVKGRGGNSCPNLFGTLIQDEFGSKMTIHHASKRTKISSLQSMSGIINGGKNVRFPYQILENHFLGWMNEITIGSAKQSCPIDAGDIVRLQNQITKIEKEFEINPDVTSLVSILKNLTAKKSGLETQLNAWKMMQARENVDTHSIGSMLAKDNSNDNRIKARSAIASIVEGIKLKVMPFGSGKCGIVDVKFFNGEQQHFAILVTRLRYGLKSESIMFDDMADLQRQLTVLWED